MVGSDNINPNEKELASATEESSVQNDTDSNLPAREDFPQEIVFRNQNHGNINPIHEGFLESLETFTNEVTLRLSQEMDSMMSMVHAQINRAVRSAISDRVIPEICNIVSSMSSSANTDTEASSSSKSQENRKRMSGLKTEITKKDSKSACDLRDTEDLSPDNNLKLSNEESLESDDRRV